MYLPEDVKRIIEVLNQHGHEAYAVGGCVRDMMLGRVPGDWDITTSAMPEETKALFEKTFDTGIEHGTITVLLNGVGYEVTTYRIDGKYEDNRHPSEVEFTRNLQEDLQRRDFTINAMAYNDKEGIVDIFGGKKDLEEKIIRCVGNAQARFGEDALRILRAIRFSAQLGFYIEEETCEGIRKLASTLENISAERIQVEMVKLIVSEHPNYIDCAYKLGVTDIIFPEWNRMMKEHPYLLQALVHTKSDKMIRIATMLYGIEELEAQRALRRWKFDNETIKTVCRLIRFREYAIQTDAYSVRCAMNQIGTELFDKYLAVKCAIDRAQGFSLDRLVSIEEIYHQIVAENQCTTLKQLAVTGNDLIACGVKQGKEIGEVLQRLLELVLEEPERNTKNWLMQQIKQTQQ